MTQYPCGMRRLTVAGADVNDNPALRHVDRRASVDTEVKDLVVQLLCLAGVAMQEHVAMPVLHQANGASPSAIGIMQQCTCMRASITDPGRGCA